MIINHQVDFSNFETKLKSFQYALKAYSPFLIAVYLFGSIAQGKIKPLSDIDIALLFDSKCNPQEIETNILIEAMRIFKTEEIDLINLNEAPLHVRYGVLKSKKLLLCTDEQKRVDFETETVMEYLDFNHIRELFFSELLKKKGVRC